MLYFGLAALLSYGLAYFICSTGLHYWRSAVGVLLGFTVGFFGSTALVALIAPKLGGSLAMKVVGQVAIWSLLLSFYGAYRARFQLKTGKPALPFNIPNLVPYVAAAVFLVGIVAAIAIPAFQNTSTFDASTAKLTVEVPQVEESNNLKPFDGKLDAEPINPFSNPDFGKPSKSPEIDWANGTITPPHQVAKEIIDRSPNPLPRKPSKEDLQEIAKAKAQEMQAKAEQAQVNADVQAIADRAIRDYPYLNTPEGQRVLDLITAKRDVYIRQGVYPSIALTRAVNDFAPAYAPQAPREAQQVIEVQLPKIPTVDSQGCGWVSPIEWKCKK